MLQKVLIIDDSPMIQRIVQRSLQDDPLEVICASNGAEGVHLAQIANPDLILLDVEMPPPDGFEVCRQLKSSEATANIPIVFLTSLSSTGEKVNGLELGAIDYVTKPFQAEELRARVRATLRTKSLSDLLARKAMIDGLTGLWNRAYLDQKLVQETSLARRTGGALSIIMVDLDKFKSFNDTHGHQFGDQVLRDVAGILRDGCRSEDAACRYGGEEFAIVTPQISLEHAAVLAERLRKTVREHVLNHRGNRVDISCSFGVAQFNQTSGEDFVAAADRALYQAKQNGRNCVVCAADDAAVALAGAIG